MEAEQKKEYKGLEIEIIDYEYEDIITVSGGNQFGGFYELPRVGSTGGF